MWKTYDGTALKGDITFEVEQMLKSEAASGHKIKVCVGTDSQVKGARTEYATVIVFLRERQGGKMLVKKRTKRQKITLKERLLTEVSFSIEAAYSIVELLNQYNIPLEVHADINSDPSFKSELSFAEAKGYIMGMGFTFKGKPHAFASSCCADKIVA